MTLGFSIEKPGQQPSSNADCLGTAISCGDTPTLLGIVCDGVSSCRHGSEAAKLACEHVISAFHRGWNDRVEPQAWLLSKLRMAHEQVIGQYPNREALCTVVAALICPHLRQVIVAHAGDSAAYRLRGRDLQKLTVDHATKEPILSNGRRVLQNGAMVTRNVTTMLLGQADGFDPELTTYSYDEGELLCLASDGVFEGDLRAYLATDPHGVDDASMTRFCENMRTKSEDDTTLLIVRLGIAFQARELVNKLSQYASFDRQARIAVIEQTVGNDGIELAVLASCLRLESDEELALALLTRMRDRVQGLTKQQWIGLLDVACERKHSRLVRSLKEVLKSI